MPTGVIRAAAPTRGRVDRTCLHDSDLVIVVTTGKPDRSGSRRRRRCAGCELIVLGPRSPRRPSAALQPSEVQVIGGGSIASLRDRGDRATARGPLARARAVRRRRPGARAPRRPRGAAARPGCASTASRGSASARWSAASVAGADCGRGVRDVRAQLRGHQPDPRLHPARPSRWCAGHARPAAARGRVRRAPDRGAAAALLLRQLRPASSGRPSSTAPGRSSTPCTRASRSRACSRRSRRRTDACWSTAACSTTCRSRRWPARARGP